MPLQGNKCNANSDGNSVHYPTAWCTPNQWSQIYQSTISSATFCIPNLLHPNTYVTAYDYAGSMFIPSKCKTAVQNASVKVVPVRLVLPSNIFTQSIKRCVSVIR